jgi:hypothetical protein
MPENKAPDRWFVREMKGSCQFLPLVIVKKNRLFHSEYFVIAG